MKQYDVRCPFCGHLNRKLYLEDTNGLMECESCGGLSEHVPEWSLVKYPTYSAGDFMIHYEEVKEAV